MYYYYKSYHHTITFVSCSSPLDLDHEEFTRTNFVHFHALKAADQIRAYAGEIKLLKRFGLFK